MSDDTAFAELVWENEGGRVLRLVPGAPGPQRAAGVHVGRIYDPVGDHDGYPGQEPATSEPGVLTEFLAGRLHSP